MDSYHSIIHQNLSLLTCVFPNLDMESKLKNGMFKKPNTKGMQSVFYSLMCIINPEYCKKSVPWPVSFTSDNYKFRTAVIDFIKNECSDFEIPKLLPSLLNKADGEKYIKFVFSFVTYVTKIVLTEKIGELILEKPDLNTNYEENMSLLDDVMRASYLENENDLNEYRIFIQNSNFLAESAVHELQRKLKDYQNKQQILYVDLRDVLSYTNITEDAVMACVIKDYEDEVIRLKQHYDSLRADAYSILKSKEYLIRLISLKQKLCLEGINVDELKSYLNEDFSTLMKVPLMTIIPSLFVNKNSDPEICLKSFLHYGHRVTKMHIQRFLGLNTSEQHLTIFQTADDIRTYTTQRLDSLSHLNSDIDNMIKCSQIVVLNSENSYFGNLPDRCYADILLMLKSYDNYCPHLNIAVIEKPLLFDFQEETESKEDTIAKIEKRIRITNHKN